MNGFVDKPYAQQNFYKFDYNSDSLPFSFARCNFAELFCFQQKFFSHLETNILTNFVGKIVPLP